MLKIRRYHDRLIFNTRIPYLGKIVFIVIETGPWYNTWIWNYLFHPFGPHLHTKLSSCVPNYIALLCALKLHKTSTTVVRHLVQVNNKENIIKVHLVLFEGWLLGFPRKGLVSGKLFHVIIRVYTFSHLVQYVTSGHLLNLGMCLSYIVCHHKW